MSARVLSVALVVLVALVLGADAASACPVCGTAKAENDWAFGLTTIVLSLMPPLMFIGGVVFLVRAHKKAQREEEREAPSISTPD